MKTIKIVCDNCGDDITTTGAYPAFRLCLKSEPLPHTGNSTMDVHVLPPIDQDKYFCGKNCLVEWVNKP